MNAKLITVVATFQAKPGKEADLKKALIGLVAPTRKEAGCINYDLHISPEDPGKFLFHENWTTRATLDAHLQNDHIKVLLRAWMTSASACPKSKSGKKSPSEWSAAVPGRSNVQ